MNDSVMPTPSLERAGRSSLRIIGVLAALTLAGSGCTHRLDPQSQPETHERAPAPVILISFDGFRWDYPDRGVSPNLAALERRGVRAEGLIPSFPSKTFPNHYTLVTGLVPDHHGIVANTMWDPGFESAFGLGKREEVADARWWGGEPVWVTAERQGLTTAPFFWPGSEAAIGGIRPTHWMPYREEMPAEERVDRVLELLDLPAAERPVFLTIYFSVTDDVGHRYGPGSRQMDDAIHSVDSSLGRLIDGLTARHMAERVNVIVVSDHGMIETSRDRVIFIDDYVDIEVARVVDWNPVLAVWPDDAHRDRVYRALENAHPALAVYRRGEIPPHLLYGSNPRTPPILGIAAPGWTISTHAYFDAHPESADGGNHGYDSEARGMQGVFIAAGPAFRRGVRVPPFRNVHVYPLLMEVLGLPARPGDGNLAEVSGLLAP